MLIMKKLNQVEYIKIINSGKLAGKPQYSSQKEPYTQKLLPELISLSKEIRAHQWWLGKWWRKIIGKNAGLFYLFEETTENAKTMSGHFLKSQLKNTVYRIDIAMIISKYIGEAEKNLGQLIEKAESKNWILFFDEADALFGKRTDIDDDNDRFMNQEPDFLLELLERYEGVAILATNNKYPLNTAFSRRIRRVINFSSSEDEDEN